LFKRRLTKRHEPRIGGAVIDNAKTGGREANVPYHEKRQSEGCNGRALPHGCIEALIDAGEVSRSEVARRKNSGR
jgi:hypothetical protein